MFSQSSKAAFSALRMLFGRWSTLIPVAALYGGLLLAGYLFVSTREATITQLVITLAAIVVTPTIFFLLQALTVNYTNDAHVALKKLLFDSLRLVVVTIPLILVAALALYGLGKLHSHLTLVSAIRYLLVAVVAPLLTIQFWIAVSRDGLRQFRRLGHVALRALAPQSLFVYVCGLLFFAVAPYFLIFHPTQTGRVWLEFSLLAFRLIASALLILIGWVTTIGTLSLLARDSIPRGPAIA